MRKVGIEAKSATNSQELFEAVNWAEYNALLGAAENLADPAARAAAGRLWVTLSDRRLALTASRDDQQKAFNQVNAVKQHVTTVDEKNTVAEGLETVSSLLRELLDIVESHWKSYVAELLSAVSAKAQSMYAKIHPREGLGDVRFFLKASVAGSLECDGAFQGTAGVPPQAYYSDITPRHAGQLCFPGARPSQR